MFLNPFLPRKSISQYQHKYSLLQNYLKGIPPGQVFLEMGLMEFEEEFAK
jgi:hypothetical protein